MKLVQVLNEKLRQPTVKEIDDFLEYRANHVALVQRLGQLAFDMDFSDHDYDKITSKGRDFDLMVLRNASKTGNLKLNDEDKNELRKISAKHAKSQKHHPEYWDDEITIRNFQADDTNIIHATKMPYRWIAEMACDWAAVILYKNEDLFAWYNKVIDNTLIMTDGQKEFLAECLILLGKIITKENIKYPGREYNAKLEEELTGLSRAAYRAGIPEEDLIAYLKKKIEDDWNLNIKTSSRSTDTVVRVSVYPDSLEKGANLAAAKEVSDKLSLDKEASNITPFDGTHPEVATNLSSEEIDNKRIFLDLWFDNNPERTGGGKRVETQETLWAEFVARKNNGLELPKAAEEFTKDGLANYGINVSFNPDPVWWDTCFYGSEFICKNILTRGHYILFRDNTIINYTKASVSVSLQGIINAYVDKRPDLFAHLPINKNTGKRDRNLWNPSDIYACRDSAYYSYKLALEKFLRRGEGSFQDIQKLLAKGLSSGDLIGISLKQCGNQPHMEYKNFSAENGLDYSVGQNYTINHKFEFPPITSEGNGSQDTAYLIVKDNDQDEEIVFSIEMDPKGGNLTYSTRHANLATLEGACSKSKINELFSQYLSEYTLTAGVPIDGKEKGELSYVKSLIKKVYALGLPIEFGGVAIPAKNFENAWDVFYEANKPKNPASDYKWNWSRAWYGYARFALLMAAARNKKELPQVLSVIRSGASKTGEVYAPLIKVY